MSYANTSSKRLSLQLALSLVVMFLVSGCQLFQEWKDRPGSVKPPKGSILFIAASDPNFSSLAAAVVKTGLDPVLSGSTELTVFAPTNQAFAKLPHPFTNANAIAGITNPAQIEALKSILLYHVLAGEVKAAAVQPGPAVTQKPAPNNTIYLSKNKKGIFINGDTRVIKADIDATNGVIHAIDKVLMFPTQNIVELAVSNPAFSTLVAAVVKANLAGTLSGNGDFTVFAPTNDAFAKLPAPFNNAANINAISDPAQITFLGNVLKYHVIAPARVFSTDLTEGLTSGTVLGAEPKLTFSLRGGASVKGKGNATASKIGPANLLTTNGVVHVIDQVLLPQ